MQGRPMSSWKAIVTPQYIPSLALVCLAVWLHAADSTLVATLIPVITKEVGGVHLISWTVMLYEIGSIVAGAASGLLAIRQGLRKPMAAAALIFSLGCIVSAFAPTMWIVLLGRVLQGFGGGGLVALAFVAMNTLFPKQLVPQALAFVSMMWGSSAFLGPLIGGLFVEYSSWRQAFAFFAVAALILAVWILKKVADKPPSSIGDQERFPLFRLLFLTSGILCIAYAGVDISPFNSPLLILTGTLLLDYFLHADSNSQNNRLLPIKPISLSNPIGAGLTMILCFAIASIALTVYGPYLMIKIYDIPVLVAGYIVACSSIGWSVAAIAISGLDESHDRKMVMLGMATITLSIIGFVYSVPNGPIWLIAVFAFIEGAGFGLAWTFILRLATNIASDDEKERIAAALPTVHRAGYALGAAYIGIVANTAGLDTADDLTSAQSAAFWVFLACLPFALLGLFAAYRFIALKLPIKLNTAD
jgi:MFS family permease